MEKLAWDRLEGKYWRPDSDVQYLVEFGNWRIEKREFSNDPAGAAKDLLILDVLSVQRDNENTLPDEPRRYVPPKEFSTRNPTFWKNIKPIITAADDAGRPTIMVMLRRTGAGKEVIYNINDAGFIQKYRR